MSAKIDQLIEIIEEVKEGHRLNPSAKISSLRLQAAKEIATRSQKHRTTIPDKYIRWLRPEISSTEGFDRHLKEWLFNNSPGLENILLKHATTEADRKRISSAFFVASEADTDLAHEFGFDPNEQAFKEGKEKLRRHWVKERNQNLIRQAKREWISSSNGNLSCEVCNFSFQKAYGKIGEEFIEAHHKIPISSMNLGTVVKPSDLAAVCSNCHSMLHRYHNPWLTVEQLRDIVNQQRIRFAS
jgi:hypothetical protein